jgi:peptide/nickel transport system permease protein
MLEQHAEDIRQTGVAPVQPMAPTAPVATEAAAIGPHSGLLEGLSPFLKNRKAVLGALMLLAFAAVALLAPVISPGDPNDIVASRHLAPSSEHIFGTSGSGQDVFDQTVWGARRSMGVGFMVGLLTTLMAALIGMTAGYFGGRIDNLLSLITNVFLIVPALPLLVVLVGFLGSGGAWYFIFVLTVTGWSWGARVLRSQTLSLREKDFVSAAEVSGEGRFRIIFGEILPNMFSLVAANMFGATIYAIGAMSALEFLGLGNPSVISWGTNLYWAGNDGALITGAWWTVVPSGLSIALVAFALALVNYAVDEVTNPRLRAQRLASQALRNSGRNLRRAGRATPVVRHAG